MAVPLRKKDYDFDDGGGGDDEDDGDVAKFLSELRKDYVRHNREQEEERDNLVEEEVHEKLYFFLNFLPWDNGNLCYR